MIFLALRTLPWQMIATTAIIYCGAMGLPGQFRVIPLMICLELLAYATTSLCPPALALAWHWLTRYWGCKIVASDRKGESNKATLKLIIYWVRSSDLAGASFTSLAIKDQQGQIEELLFILLTAFHYSLTILFISTIHPAITGTTLMVNSSIRH